MARVKKINRVWKKGFEGQIEVSDSTEGAWNVEEKYRIVSGNFQCKKGSTIDNGNNTITSTYVKDGVEYDCVIALNSDVHKQLYPPSKQFIPMPGLYC